MKNKSNVLFSLMIMLAGVTNFAVLAQQKNGTADPVETKTASSSEGPKSIVRNIKQDRKGNIWITSWEGIFKYDGKSFINVTSKVSLARFFSVLEDRKGNLWFGSLGSGVYYYDGKYFQNFTTKNGLAGDQVSHIYEDKNGMIWFGTNNGASRYDGKSFQNLKMNETPAVSLADSIYAGPATVRTLADSVHVSAYQQQHPQAHWVHNDVNAIIEDKTGKLWFATRGNATVYDGKAFKILTNPDGVPFTNVRSIIKDKKGNIWLGGKDGLWRYDGSLFTNFTQKFVGYIYEDKKGNIWTSSEIGNAPGWILSRYDAKSLADGKPTATEIKSEYEGNKSMIFGILEDDKGNIWFGAMDGVYRFDGKTVTGFRGKDSQE